MNNGESEFEVKFGVTPFFDVPKIEYTRFWEFPCNKKPGLTGFRVNEGRGIRQTGPKGQKVRTTLALTRN